MSMNDRTIQLTLRMDRDLYSTLHEYCIATDAPHVRVIRTALKVYLTEERLKLTKKARDLR